MAFAGLEPVFQRTVLCCPAAPAFVRTINTLGQVRACRLGARPPQCIVRALLRTGPRRALHRGERSRIRKDDQASGAYHVRIFMKNARAHPAKDVRRVLVATPASLDGDPIWPIKKKGPLAETLRQGVLFTAQSLDVDGRHDQEKGRRQPPGSIRVLGVDKDG